MNYLKLALLLSMPFFVQTSWTTTHHNLGEKNEKIRGNLEALDGIVINGGTVLIMVTVGRDLQRFIHGDRNPADKNKRIGKYTLNGQAGLTIEDLRQRQAADPSNPELASILVAAKKDFEEMVAPFINQARGTKMFLILSIEESCKRRQRTNSLLLAWANAPDGHETVLFHNEINTFQGLCDFCNDLTNFLGDLIETCPLAKEQYKKRRNDFNKEHNKQ